MAKTFRQMVADARAEVNVLSPTEVQERVQQDPNALVIDVRQADDRGDTGVIPGSVNVPLGLLAIKADSELPEGVRDERLQDRDQAVYLTCGPGGQAALGAKILKDMGFNNVNIIDGGTRGWKAAGLPTEEV